MLADLLIGYEFISGWWLLLIAVGGLGFSWVFVMVFCDCVVLISVCLWFVS